MRDPGCEVEMELFEVEPGTIAVMERSGHGILSSLAPLATLQRAGTHDALLSFPPGPMPLRVVLAIADMLVSAGALGLSPEQVAERQGLILSEEALAERQVEFERALSTAPPVWFKCDAHALVCLIGQLQLALRHPNNRGPSAQAARQFILEAAKMLPPAVASCMHLGFDPRADQERDRGDKAG